MLGDGRLTRLAGVDGVSLRIDLEPGEQVVGLARRLEDGTGDECDPVRFSGWTELMVAVDALRSPSPTTYP